MSIPAMQPTPIIYQRANARIAEYERVASHLRQVASELSQLQGVENTAYWEWDQQQSGPAPLRMPLEFTAWTLIREAELLEARARELRGERR